MENKKPIIIGVVVLVMAVTAWVLVGKFKDLKNSKNDNTANIPASSEPQKEAAVTTEESVVTQGVVTGVTSDSVTLKSEMGEKIIAIQPEARIYVKDETGLPVEIKITDLKKNAEVVVIQKEPVTREKVVASSIIQGTVTNIADGKISIKTGEGEKVVDITTNPTVYIGDGDKVVDMKTSDIKIGSKITVAYTDVETQLQVVGIRIDEL